MELQAQSIKIQKKRRMFKSNECNFFCGGCQSAYRSYPALYLHIKRKHNGIKPPNTVASRLNEPQPAGKSRDGRSQKPSNHVDDIDERQLQIEQLQSEFLGFLGEELKIICLMGQKPKLEEVVLAIGNMPNEGNDDAITQIKKKIDELSQDLRNEWIRADEPDLDFDTFCELDKNNSLKVLCWFILWLGKYVVKTETLQDLMFIFSKIWVVLTEKQLGIQDLDNKLIWNSIMKECEPYLSSLEHFAGKKELIYEFLSKVCHLIGKIFE